MHDDSVCDADKCEFWIWARADIFHLLGPQCKLVIHLLMTCSLIEVLKHGRSPALCNSVGCLAVASCWCCCFCRFSSTRLVYYVNNFAKLIALFASPYSQSFCAALTQSPSLLQPAIISHALCTLWAARHTRNAYAFRITFARRGELSIFQHKYFIHNSRKNGYYFSFLVIVFSCSHSAHRSSLKLDWDVCVWECERVGSWLFSSFTRGSK